MNQFVIHRVNKKTDGQYQFVGDIASGDMTVGDILHIQANDQSYKIPVLDIHLLDEISQKVDYIGLLVSGHDLEHLEGCTAIVTAP